MIANTALAPGDLLLGKYRVERVLGQGGMGSVFSARHIELAELYAIKVMLPNALGNQDAEERFLREARIAAKLESEHVARVFDVGRADDGSLFMVMEHLKGRDLKAHLAERRRLPSEEAITYVRQACEALAEAHEMGIVHRDIKPANLFLTHKRKNPTPFIKILDFGISKELQPAEGQDLTKTGTMLGSPLYMSPEQMLYSRKVDARTDIWSLGVVLYELVTGVVPFSGETFTHVVHSVMSLEPEPIQTFVADLPAALDVVIQRCLQKDAAERYPSVDELSAALEKVLKNEPVERSSSNSFVHKSLADTESAGRAGAELSLSDARKSEQPMVTLRNAPPIASNEMPSPSRRTTHVGIVVIGAMAAVGVAVLGVRWSNGAGAKPAGTAPTEQPQDAPQRAGTAVVETSVPKPVTSASNDGVGPSLGSSTDVLPSPAKTTVRSSSVKPLPSSDDRTAPAPTIPSTDPSATRRRRTLL